MFYACKSKTTQTVQQAGVEYYRNLQFSETPFDIERGTHKLTPEEAKNINSYKFTYDESGRLASVEYVRGDVLLGYSDLGSAAKIVYTYDGYKQTKYVFDKDNKPVENRGIYAYEYILDDSGMRRSLMLLDKDGKMIDNRDKIHSYT